MSNAEYNYGNPPPLGANATFMGFPPAPKQDPPMRDYRAHSLTQTFDLKSRFKDPRPMWGFGLLGSCDGFSARLAGQAGYDFVFIDWEHTPMGIREMTEAVKWVQYASEGQTAAFVRIPTEDRCWVAWALDAGASAVILPHSETVEQVERIISFTQFPNKGNGQRSFAPAALQAGHNNGAPQGRTMFDTWHTAGFIAQIESKKGAENADAIAAIPGVDAIMIGNSDLRFDLKLPPGFDGEEESYKTCVNKVLAAAKKYDKPVMMITNSPALVKKRAEQGLRMFVVEWDTNCLTRGMRKTLTESTEIFRTLKEGK